MKKFNIIGLLLAFVGVLSLASCEHQYADYTPGEQDKGMGVYFPSTAAINVTDADTSFDIVVARVKSDAAASVTLRSEAKDAEGTLSELFTIPSSVDFAAGATEANLTITFDGSKLEIGKKYGVSIKLDEAEASKYAISEYTFTVMIPEPWVSLGEGIYFDDLLCRMMEEADAFAGSGAYVEFEQHELNANRIRVKNAYSAATIGAMWGGVPTFFNFTAEGDTYVEFDITDPNNVIAGDVLEFSDGSKACAYPLHIDVSNNGTVYQLYCLTWMDSPIVLEDGIIKFPTDGSVELAAFNGGSYMGYFSQANPTGYMQFLLPGTEFVNYDMVAEYDGMYVSADGATAKAIFNFAFGADVASYKFAFVQGDVTADPSEVAEAIVAGSEDLVIFEGDAATKKWEVELTKGIWTLVAVPYTADGEARLQNTYAYNFYFNGTGEMPEVNLDVQVGAPASFAAEENQAAVEAETPACYWIGVNIAGNPDDLKSMKAWWGAKASYQNAASQGLNDDALLSNYAADLYTENFIGKMAETGAVTVRVNVDNCDSEYVVLFRAVTIYGTVIEHKFEYTLPEYDGDVAVGTYSFTDGEGEEAKTLNFSLLTGKSYNDFYFIHDDVDSSAWYVTYDAAAGTLTNEGILLGYESEGSQYGKLYGYFNQDGTQVYGYMSSAVESYETIDPMVMTLENGVVAGLQTYYGMFVYGYEGGQVTGVLGTYYNFTPATVIAPAAAAQSASQFAPKAAAMKACVADSAIASEAKVVINATPVATTFAQAQLSLMR